MQIIRNIHAIALAAACAAMTVASAAPTYAQTVSQTVSTQGLDLHLAVDQATLRHRITSAARRVCTQDDYSAVDSLQVDDCERAAFDAGWTKAQVKIAAARTDTMVASASTK